MFDTLEHDTLFLTYSNTGTILFHSSSLRTSKTTTKMVSEVRAPELFILTHLELSKYGFGVLFSNHNVSIVFNDSSKIVSILAGTLSTSNVLVVCEQESEHHPYESVTPPNYRLS